MKRLLLAFAALTLCAGVAAAQIDYNEIGIYTTADANPDNAVYNGAPGPGIMAYVVVSNPFNTHTGGPIGTVGGFEFKIVLPANVFMLNVTLPANTTNFASSPEFLCGANVPVNGGRATLLTLTLGEFSGAPSPVYLAPVSNAPPSVPGNIAITDYNDDFSISVAYPSSGDFALPVFGLWTSVVPTEDASWGEVKSLFR